MQNKSYSTTIAVAQSAEEVFKKLLEVSKWWSKDFEGNSTKVNDVFVIHHPGAHYSKQKLIEVIPNKKIVWLVTESKLDWLTKDKQEWTNTEMIFDINTKENNTLLHFTHEGLVPEMECYKRVEEGWNMVIKERFYNFITTGKEI